jgi:putative redox protein
MAVANTHTWDDPFQRYFGVHTAKEGGMTTHETGHDAASSEGAVTVAETGSGTYTQQITIGHHGLVADEPRPIGDDAGPTPYDLLLAALGSCTSMTVRMYANRKGWQLERVQVTLRHSRIHAEDCANCETCSGLIDHIDRDLELAGDLDDTQRQRLLQIAERCPVHQTLTSEVDIATSLV